ncbi:MULTISPECIES: lytic murein transglycosylase [unclassified Nocardioides]|uniref:lytic murein transglycosylase n=1 Tax=unclassified Nocardioides TaxID=2615069 RepID=UPI000703A31B|nr:MULTISPECIES: lytic murein transglycosylase [unclassified Nocardioides]KRC56994.1 hypothetical protein ASE19_04120 [Nocardioides sp. Root79]KRC77203.1 hypothetical protein ASE20_02985 [Nocardioides sp. Root240]
MSRSRRHRRSRASALPAALRRTPSPRVVAALLLPVVAGTAASAVCVASAAPAGELRSGTDRAPAPTVYDAPYALRAIPARQDHDHVVVLLWGAYARAVGAAPVDCHLPLSLLAAIGQVGSGSLSGRSLDATHRAVPAVLGPVLDGRGRAAVADTDHGTLDGNPRWDRAIGPMQLLPGTWTRFARDGDGDGSRDPQDIDDAAATAATYLCAGERDLADSDDLTAALLGSAHPAGYVGLVLALKENLDAELSRQVVTALLVAPPVSFEVPAATRVAPARTAVRHVVHATVALLPRHPEPAGPGAAAAPALPFAVEVDPPAAPEVPSCPAPVEAPVEEPVEAPVDEPVEAPLEEPAGGPVEEPAEPIDDADAPACGEELSPVATDVPTDAPTDVPADLRAELPAVAADAS